jgi:DNA-directed RNA polymerase subunit E'/Rpb7
MAVSSSPHSSRMGAKKRARSGSSSELLPLPPDGDAPRDHHFEEVNLKVAVSLLPSSLADVFKAIRANVYQLLMRYNESVGGVILSLSDVKFPDSAETCGRIVDEKPHVHFSLTAKSVVFRPLPGSMLVGTVTKVASSHVGMLVYGIFNASIYARDLESAAELAYDEGGGVWRGPGLGVITVGATVRFKVRRLYQAQGLISIEGEGEAMSLVAGAGALASSASAHKKLKRGKH